MTRKSFGMFGTRAAIAAVLLTAQPVWAETKPLPLPNSFASDKADREISVVVDRGLRRTNNLPTRALRNARLAMLEGETLEPDVLRHLADHRDSLAALRYVDVLMELGLEENASDIAYYASIAVGAGRVWALPEMVAALKLLDPNTEPRSRINKYMQVLYPHAWAGNTLALDAVIDFNGEGRLFGALSRSTASKIEKQLAQSEDGRGDLKIAISILRQPEMTQEDRERALMHLHKAKSADHLAVATTAANLVEQLAKQQGEHSALASN